jgi:hypothetical protein
MRARSLLSLAFTAALGSACRPEVASVPEREEVGSHTAAPTERDLTLQVGAAPAVEVASPVELSLPKPAPAPSQPSRSRARPRPKLAPTVPAESRPDSRPAPVAVPAVAVAEAEPVARPAPAADAASGRELAPGETVRILPTSNEPAIEADSDDSWLESERPRGTLVGGGGTCRPRKGVRGIGIAGRIPVTFPPPRLR